MNDMTNSIEHDISVVPILDLKQETENGIGSHAFDKVSSRLEIIVCQK